MTIIYVPDEHPGRCRNWRHDASTQGQSVRCLEAENTEHVCRFPAHPAPIPSVNTVVYDVHFTKSDPKPWVVPPKD